MKSVLIFIGGFIVLILGMTLLLRNWSSALIVWQGVAPAAIAVAGLVMMFAASLKK